MVCMITFLLCISLNCSMLFLRRVKYASRISKLGTASLQSYVTAICMQHTQSFLPLGSPKRSLAVYTQLLLNCQYNSWHFFSAATMAVGKGEGKGKEKAFSRATYFPFAFPSPGIRYRWLKFCSTVRKAVPPLRPGLCKHSKLDAIATQAASELVG